MTGGSTVTPEQLKSQAKVYQRSALQIQEVVNQINSMNQQISQQGQEEAFQAYLEKYRKLEGKIKQLEQLLDSFHKQLLEYADKIAAQDQNEEGSSGLG